MTYRKLAVPDAWEITPTQHGDSRGSFLEAFQDAPFRTHTGRPFTMRQVNTSISAAGVIRGIHFSDVPPGQAKYVTCVRGAVLDVAVDLRVGSPSFGAWDSVLLDDVDRRAIFLAEGLGHAFLSLEDDSTVVYLCSTSYAPTREHGISPLDPALSINWPTTDRHGNPLTPILSAKDEAAPSLDQAIADDLLPRYSDFVAFVTSLGR